MTTPMTPMLTVKRYTNRHGGTSCRRNDGQIRAFGLNSGKRSTRRHPAGSGPEASTRTGTDKSNETGRVTLPTASPTNRRTAKRRCSCYTAATILRVCGPAATKPGICISSPERTRITRTTPLRKGDVSHLCADTDQRRVNAGISSHRKPRTRGTGNGIVVPAMPNGNARNAQERG
mgnify:CR=1 FL=1